MALIYILLALFSGGLISYFLFTPKRKQISISNKEIENKEKDYEFLNTNAERLQSQIDSLIEKIDIHKINLESLAKAEKQRRDSLSYQVQLEKEKYEAAIEEYKNEYLKTMEEGTSSYQETIAIIGKRAEEYGNMLKRLQEIMEASVEANKRALENKIDINYYKIKISQNDLNDVHKLRTIKNQLNNQEIINKLIWKTYFEKPTQEMVGRVVGSGIVTGIYKITDQTTQRVYIGQSVNYRRMKNFSC